MKNIVCWRNKFLSIGMIVFLIMMMSSCSDKTTNSTETGSDTHWTEQTGITTAITAITTALNGDNQTVIPFKAAMIISTNFYPWNPPTELQTGMDGAFGAGSWDQLDMDTETGAAFASGSPYTFIYLEGSALNGQPLINYLTAHITEIETWVNNGGRLYINAAIQNSLSVNAPFSVTIQGDNDKSDATAVDPLHPIFNGPFLPAGTTYTGIPFGFSRIVGTGITNIIVSTGDSTLSYLSSAEHGTGFILYGGIASDKWQSPQPNAHNLFMNILSYAAGI